jgi:hypothetical protein
MECVGCGSAAVSERSGRTAQGYRRFRCRSCGKQFNERSLQGHPAARVIIPPRSTAVLSEAGTTQRDEHLRSIETHGRIGWQRRSGYGRRSLVETAMYRYKTIIGRRLHPPDSAQSTDPGQNRLQRAQ